MRGMLIILVVIIIVNLPPLNIFAHVSRQITEIIAAEAPVYR